MKIPVKPEDLQKWENNQANCEVIQRHFSYLTADQREFINTGVTAEEWDKAFPEESEEDNETEAPAY